MPDQEDALAGRCLGALGEGQQLRFGQRGVIVGRTGPVEHGDERRPLRRGQLAQVDHGHVQSVHCGQRNPVP